MTNLTTANQANYQSIPSTEIPNGGTVDNNNDDFSVPLPPPPPPPPIHHTRRGRSTEFPEISALVAEFFGTATFVQIGCGANCVGIILDGMSGMWQRGVVWALGLMIAIYISAAQSGGHLNPAVSLAFALVRRDDFSLHKVLPYWIAQLAGAFVAGGINLFLFTTAISNYEATLEIGDEDFLESASAFGNYWSFYGNVENGLHAAIIEAYGTAILCFVIFATTNPKTCVPPSSVPVFVGITYGLMVVLFGPLTGAGMNPARDMGPRLVTLFGHWGTISMINWFPYFLGPMIGGPIGAFLADKVLLLQESS